MSSQAETRPDRIRNTKSTDNLPKEATPPFITPPRKTVEFLNDGLLLVEFSHSWLLDRENTSQNCPGTVKAKIPSNAADGVSIGSGRCWGCGQKVKFPISTVKKALTNH